MTDDILGALLINWVGAWLIGWIPVFLKRKQIEFEGIVLVLGFFPTIVWDYKDASKYTGEAHLGNIIYGGDNGILVHEMRHVFWLILGGLVTVVVTLLLMAFSLFTRGDSYDNWAERDAENAARKWRAKGEPALPWAIQRSGNGGPLG